MVMKNDKNKVKEPFPPEQTPNPPQIIDPSRKNERGENEPPVEDKSGKGKQNKTPDANKE